MTVSIDSFAWPNPDSEALAEALRKASKSLDECLLPTLGRTRLRSADLQMIVDAAQAYVNLTSHGAIENTAYAVMTLRSVRRLSREDSKGSKKSSKADVSRYTRSTESPEVRQPAAETSSPAPSSVPPSKLLLAQLGLAEARSLFQQVSNEAVDTGRVSVRGSFAYIDNSGAKCFWNVGALDKTSVIACEYISALRTRCNKAELNVKRVLEGKEPLPNPMPEGDIR